MSKRDSYRYHLKKGKRVVRDPVDEALERRELERARSHVSHVGRQAMKDAARAWENEQRDKGKPIESLNSS